MLVRCAILPDGSLIPSLGTEGDKRQPIVISASKGIGGVGEPGTPPDLKSGRPKGFAGSNPAPSADLSLMAIIKVPMSAERRRELHHDDA